MPKRIIPNFIKETIKKNLREREFQSFKMQANQYTEQDLMSNFKRFGIKEGDVLLVHSSLKALGYINGGPKTVINALLKSIGPEGTLAFPVFTMKNSMYDTLSDNNFVFDPFITPSTVGKITEEFRKMKNVKRSIHPTHSIAALGKHADAIVKDHHLQETNFGVGTPFEKLLNLGGKIVGLGVGFGPVTFYHAFEDLNLNLFPEVYLKEKLIVNVSVNNEAQKVAINCHNPEFHRSRIEKMPAIESFFREDFTSSGIAHWGKVGSSQSWWISSADLIKRLEILYHQGKTIYKI